MTKREKGLLILTGFVIVGGLVFNFGFRMDDSAKPVFNSETSLREADHLLRFSRNIIARNKVVNARLQELQKRFFPVASLENSKLSMLKEVEMLAAQSNLAVQQKNMGTLKDDVIGVTLEGKANPESLIRFLQSITQDRIGFQVQRLQIHTLPESKQLNYQVTVISLLWK